ncbi:MAG: hypothetical protein CVU89_10830 [Firmicutes bacterium HGW-Firmicutes-14]|jgi:uncharacterized coiled-coil protein SlyX|nr:MAG: hypothetical protein CVU89_10830 [Firmicutes bacterium HGW-Firmicutes-14]
MKQKKFQEFVINHLTNQSAEIKSIKGDVSSLNHRAAKQETFQELALNNFASINNRLAEHESLHELTAKHLVNLSERMSSFEKNLVRLETRIENEVIEKLHVLVDGYLQHEHRLDRIENKLGLNM